jgi:hypothetical protein
MGETHASEPAPGEGAVRFSHTGHRYVLGYGADFFGIWDRERPGGPVLRYPRSDEGWDEAWNRYVGLEPKHVEVPEAGMPPDTPIHAGSYASTRVLGRWTAALVGVSLLLGLLSASFWAVHLRALDRVEAGETSVAELSESEELVEIGDGLAILSFMPAGIVWLVWQHRSHRNLRGLGVEDLGFSPRWAVAWWFVPIANIVMPYLAMRELWKASDPNAEGVGWRMLDNTLLLPLWWAGRLAAQFSWQVGGFVGDTGDIPSLVVQSRWGIAAGLIIAAWGVLAIVIVQKISGRQQQKYQRIVTWSGGLQPAS